jgi:hypothetical protein
MTELLCRKKTREKMFGEEDGDISIDDPSPQAHQKLKKALSFEAND